MVIKYDKNSELNCQNKLIVIMSDNIDIKVCNELGLFLRIVKYKLAIASYKIRIVWQKVAINFLILYSVAENRLPYDTAQIVWANLTNPKQQYWLSLWQEFGVGLSNCPTNDRTMALLYSNML